MEVLRAEVELEPGLLEDYAKTRVPRAPNGAIFVGAGDSYAAALAGFYGSGGRCAAMDPYALRSAPQAARGLEVFFISASGRTSSNLAAAEAVTGLARRTVAITAEASSPLSGKCDDVLALPMKYEPRMPGLVSFGLSLLAVMKAVRAAGKCDLESAFASAVEDCNNVLTGKGTTYFLGNSLAYPAARYAAAKTYEFLGSKAHAELLEEFSHMELFTLEKPDVVNVFAAFDPSGLAGRLGAALAMEGYTARVVPSRGTSDLERLFHAVFVCQLSALNGSAGRRLSRPRFLSDRGRLETSDSMIY